MKVNHSKFSRMRHQPHECERCKPNLGERDWVPGEHTIYERIPFTNATKGPTNAKREHQISEQQPKFKNTPNGPLRFIQNPVQTNHICDSTKVDVLELMEPSKHGSEVSLTWYLHKPQLTNFHTKRPKHPRNLQKLNWSSTKAYNHLLNLIVLMKFQFYCLNSKYWPKSTLSLNSLKIPTKGLNFAYRFRNWKWKCSYTKFPISKKMNW